MKKIDSTSIRDDLLAIRKQSPLVHNITNYVVMEKTANSLLALGASPVMAHACEEVSEMTRIADSLVINIGTLSSHWIESMHLALKASNDKGIPVVLDPVGAGATSYRTNTVRSLLSQGVVAVIRGNASEIANLQGHCTDTKGVDSTLKTNDYIDQAMEVALLNHCVVWMSGASDVVTDGSSCVFIDNGNPIMERVTGMGCTASAITGAFLAVNKDALAACVHAAAVMGISGEIAACRSKGPGTFSAAFLDTLYTITPTEINAHICMRNR